MATQGTLLLTVMEATLQRDIGTADDLVMDPYVVIRNKSNAMRTNTIENGGKSPIWNETLEITVSDISDDIHLRVMDENIGSNCEIGSCNVSLRAVCVQGGLEQWYPISFGNKVAGRVRLCGEWCPSGSDPVSIAAATMPGLQQTVVQESERRNMGQTMLSGQPNINSYSMPSYNRSVQQNT